MGWNELDRLTLIVTRHRVGYVRVLVTGGTGYIGAHFVRLLAERGDRVIVVDDGETGDASRIPGFHLERFDLASDMAVATLSTILREHSIDLVVHFAARKQVGESVYRPAWYFQQNVTGLANLLLAMEQANVRQFIFSSSASVYAPSDAPVTEESPTKPLSPYGETKLIGEWLVRDSTLAWPLKAVSLRYFNVAGAASPELGDTTALNLIPMVIEKIVAGEAPIIFGDNYATPDGTCIRDYVHVQDVVEAHLAVVGALHDLEAGHHIFNVGSGSGTSVREIVDAVLAVADVDLVATIEGRREGDAAVVIASVDRILREIGWRSRFGLKEIVRSSWDSRLK